MEWLSKHKWSLILILLIILAEILIYSREYLGTILDSIGIYILTCTGILGVLGFPISNYFTGKSKIITRILASIGLGSVGAGIAWGQHIISEIKSGIDLYFLFIPLILILIFVIILFIYNINRDHDIN